MNWRALAAILVACGAAALLSGCDRGESSRATPHIPEWKAKALGEESLAAAYPQQALLHITCQGSCPVDRDRINIDRPNVTAEVIVAVDEDSAYYAERGLARALLIGHSLAVASPNSILVVTEFPQVDERLQDLLQVRCAPAAGGGARCWPADGNTAVPVEAMGNISMRLLTKKPLEPPQHTIAASLPGPENGLEVLHDGSESLPKPVRLSIPGGADLGTAVTELQKAFGRASDVTSESIKTPCGRIVFVTDGGGGGILAHVDTSGQIEAVAAEDLGSLIKHLVVKPAYTARPLLIVRASDGDGPEIEFGDANHRPLLGHIDTSFCGLRIDSLRLPPTWNPPAALNLVVLRGGQT